jgi:hypothetical protein
MKQNSTQSLARNLNFKAKRYYINFSIILKCLVLKLKNIFLLRSLVLDNVQTSDLIIIEGNTFEVSWKVKGCHKIKVNNYFTIPGNCKNIRMYSSFGASEIQIIFYGFMKKIAKTIKYQAVKLELLNNFESSSHLPKAEAFKNINDELNLSEKIVQTKFKFDEPTLIMDEIQIELSPYKFDLYKPETYPL